MLQLNYKSGVPISDQIVNGFIRMKALKIVNSGDQLPSVRSLAIELSVNPNTIQKAYQILESNGIIYSVKGKGSFISDSEAANTAVIKAAVKDFTDSVVRANELGLNKNKLIEIVNQVSEKEENK